MKRIGIYGGTFDPPHLGHFRAARYAMEALQLTQLLMIPTGISPHKQPGTDAPTPEQRLDMVRLGAPEGATACDLEVRRNGPSYTWQTVEQLRQAEPEAELFLLLGADMFAAFPDWRFPEKILENASLAVFCRGGKEEEKTVSETKARLETMGARVELLNNPVTAISSTDVRRLLAFGCAAEFLPAAVERYIYENGLYGTGRPCRDLSIEELEREVVRLLKPGRVAHVLGCAKTAGELARRYGANETDAVRAGLLHDITKALDGPLQLTLCRSYGRILDDFSAQNPKTLHALTGSLVAERIFGENEAVVRAIRCHTTGKPDMDLLEKIIYVADYMEPCRDFPGVEKLRQLAYEDITEALKLGLTMTLDMLRKQGREISPESKEALAFLEKEERKRL